jgi:hypothetical protein
LGIGRKKLDPATTIPQHDGFNELDGRHVLTLASGALKF